MASFLKDCLTIPGTVSVVISHKDFMSARFLAKARAYFDSIPDTVGGIPVKPQLHHKAGHLLTWPEINSVFYIGSAQAPIEERGDTIHNFLGSEVSRWPDPKKILDAVEESVPVTGWLVLESTPWGEGNLFHEYWKAARDKKSVYTPHFYPWWLGGDYAFPMGSDKALETTDQIRWRRRKISERKSEFWQEYPEDPVTCFYTTAKAVFDLERLASLAHGCHSAPFSYQGARVWVQPEKGETYVVGCDPSEGVRDPAAATVWRVGDFPSHCATFTGLLDPISFGARIMELGEYYNKATLVVESNGPGLAVLNAITPYKRIYYQVNLATGQETTTPGWRTTEQSKSFAIALFRDMLYNIDTHDIELIQQARNMRFVDPKDMGSRRSWGRLPLKVISTGLDDIIMSAVIALAAIDTVPKIKRGIVGYAPGWRW